MATQTRFIPNPLWAEEVKLTPELNAVILEKAQHVEDTAKALVPVETGALRDSIQAKLVGPAEADITAGGGDVRYALYVERGTSLMDAEPYLAPALDTLAGT